jgi:hypothetical protein
VRFFFDNQMSPNLARAVHGLEIEAAQALSDGCEKAGWMSWYGLDHLRLALAALRAQDNQ